MSSGALSSSLQGLGSKRLSLHSWRLDTPTPAWDVEALAAVASSSPLKDGGGPVQVGKGTFLLSLGLPGPEVSKRSSFRAEPSSRLGHLGQVT